jgi:hypothetical protein
LNFENSASSFGLEKGVYLCNDLHGNCNQRNKQEEIEEMVKILAECNMVN